MKTDPLRSFRGQFRVSTTGVAPLRKKKRRAIRPAAIFSCCLIQYFGIVGSMSFDQPMIPPARFQTFLKPF